jgi:GAF domain-containing protein
VTELPPELTRTLLHVVDEALPVEGAAKGNLQLVDRATQALRLVVQRGFDDAFLRTFASVSWDDATACGRAFRTAARIVIPDITLDAAYLPYVDIARAAGYLAVQSTPILDANGQVIGVLSTHFSRPQSLSKKAGHALDALARNAARRIAEFIG